MATKLTFRVADCTIVLRSETDIELEEGYLPYEVEGTETPEIIIDAVPGLPVDLLSGRPLLFDAENEHQKFYTIYEMPEGLGFAIYNQQTHSDIQQIAVLSADYRSEERRVG